MDLKQLADIEAAEFVKGGMIAGLRTDSIAYYMTEETGRRMYEEGLRTTGVTTSDATKEQAEELGVPLKSVDEVPVADLTVDGTDETSADFQGVKGDGVALLFEKIAATYSKETVWIVDPSGSVDKLGKFPPPVGVIPYGSQQLLHISEEKRFQPVLRTDENREVLATDGGHCIIDLHLKVIEQPESLTTYLDELVEVVEHGLFLNMVFRVVVGSEESVGIFDAIRRKQRKIT